MNTLPLVSVIIPTYNGEKYLRETIASVAGQTYLRCEVIVVDDGSTGRSVADICGEYGERLKYIRQENRGLSAARNTGIRASTGAYVAFLDDDDLWLPEKIERQMAFYERLTLEGRQPGLVNTGVVYMSETGVTLSKTLYRFAGNGYGKLIHMDYVSCPSSVMVARSVLDRVGFFDEQLIGMQDYDLWIRIAREYPIFSLNEHLVRHRSRDGSLSGNVESMIRDAERIFRKVLAEDKGPARDRTEFERRLKRHFDRSCALRWKEAAYGALYDSGNGGMFREYVRKGRAIDPAPFGWKDRMCELLSCVVPALCIAWGKRRRAPQADILVDVDQLNFE